MWLKKDVCHRYEIRVTNYRLTKYIIFCCKHAQASATLRLYMATYMEYIWNNEPALAIGPTGNTVACSEQCTANLPFKSACVPTSETNGRRRSTPTWLSVLPTPETRPTLSWSAQLHNHYGDVHCGFECTPLDDLHY